MPLSVDDKQAVKTVATKAAELATGGFYHLSLNAETLKKSRFFTDHEIVKLIGKGAYGSVFLAEIKNSGKLCALKKITIGDDTTTVDDAKKEAWIQKNLEHPNIVRFDASWMEPELPGLRECKTFYIRMEYCVKGTLRSAISSSMNELRLWFLVEQLVRVVNYVHQKGFAHCDLKSNNVFIDDKGCVKLGDFGNAERIGSFSTDLRTIVYTGYEADLVKGDIKELAAILYEMCYGPFETDEDLESALDDFKQQSVASSEFREDSVLPVDQLIRLLLNEDFSKLPKPQVEKPESEDILAEFTDLFIDEQTSPEKDNVQPNAKPSVKQLSTDSSTSGLNFFFKIFLFICSIVCIFLYKTAAPVALLIFSGIEYTAQRLRAPEKAYIEIVKMVARVT